MRRASFFAVVGLIASTVALTGPNAVAAKHPLKCRKQNATSGVGAGFRFCSGFVATKDHSEKLDVDVTLPKRGAGPFPLLVYLHGLGGSKKDFELRAPTDPDYDPTRDGSVKSSGDRFENNNYWYASKGFAVLTYTARGFQKDTCLDPSIQSIDGKPDYGDSPACLPQLDNVNYEVKDTQNLVGRLVDGTLLSADVSIAPRRVGIEGVSYGGGQAWMLSRLNQWKSPRGARVRVAADVPVISWTDLADALIPNGRARDDQVPTTDVTEREAQPVGVLKRSFVSGFHAVLQVKSQEVGTIPGYLEAWYNRLTEPGPYTDPVAQDALDKVITERSALFIPRASSFETPIFAINGWDDMIFPPVQAIQMYNSLRSQDPDYPISVYLGGIGHQTSENKPAEQEFVNGVISKFLTSLIIEREQPTSTFAARTTTCDMTQLGALYSGPTYATLQGSPLNIQFPLAGTLFADANDPHAGELNPILIQDANRCRVMNLDVANGNLAAQQTLDRPLTMLGLPQVTLDADPSGSAMYVAAHLFDVNTQTGKQTLVTRGVYRLGGTDTQHVVFQLFGNNYDFPQGDALKLELTANDSPSFLTPDDPNASILISNVSLTVPTANPATLVP
ncbi:MAG: hypothetical protein M3290_01215 [Actinomycetota bacterium]|nr:hypothetical protein [Actinomycetota bacterium]